MRKLIIFLGLVLLSSCALARDDIREVFKNNSAIIYTINIRNFGALDRDLDGLIESPVDIKGTFVNAKEKLKDLSAEGVNVIYVLPITKVGKVKALGTAGSLYAMDSFDELNKQMEDKDIYKEAKDFVDEAHKLGLNVIVDLPSCGSYDYSLRKPDLFLLNEKEQNVVPADWSDVRMFKADKNVLENFKKFVDMVQSLGFDGIRADVAAIKPSEFWKGLITYARDKNKSFLFLAEASPDWSNPTPNNIVRYSSIDELLSAGFDSYYGSWSDFKNVKTKEQFDKKIIQNQKILKRNKNSSIIGALSTHDQPSSVLRGLNYWNMVLWLNVTLPMNSYFLDGFSVGDDYSYPYENKKANTTQTDDEYYFVHSGQFDIFNFSSQVEEKYPKLKKTYLKALDFKQNNLDLITKGKFKLINTANDNVFGYSITVFDRELIVVGNLDETNKQKIQVESQYLKKDFLFSLINAKNPPKYERNIITTTLEPLEIQVYLISLAKYRAM